jgi:hypothetical protein
MSFEKVNVIMWPGLCSNPTLEWHSVQYEGSLSSNVFYRYFDTYHYFIQSRSKVIHFVKYVDSDSKSNNIIYLLCDVSRS